MVSFQTMEVVLSGKQEATVRELIASGVYGSTAEVMDAALDLLAAPRMIEDLEGKLLEGIRSPRSELTSNDFDGIRAKIRTQFEA